MFDLFRKKTIEANPGPKRATRPARHREMIDLRGDGRILIWDVTTQDSEVSLFDVDPPYQMVGFSVITMASLILLRKDGWYTFRKDRSGGIWIDELIQEGLVDRRRVILGNGPYATERCCPLSEKALRFLALVV